MATTNNKRYITVSSGAEDYQLAPHGDSTGGGKLDIPMFNPTAPTRNTPDPRKTGGGGSGSSGGLGYKTIKARSADELAALYGIMNKREDIAGVLNQATEAKFGMWDQQTKALRDQQLTDYASQVSQMQNMQRQNRQNALRSGLSRGAAGAQEVLSQFYTQQQGNQNQQYYQQQLGDIAAEKAGQVGADIYNAMAMSNEIGMGLGGLSVGQQTNDVQNQGNYWNYAGQVANANAIKYSADQNYASVLNNPAQKTAYDYGIGIGLSPDLAYAVAKDEMTVMQALDKMKKKEDSVGTPPYDPLAGESTTIGGGVRVKTGK